MRLSDLQHSSSMGWQANPSFDVAAVNHFDHWSAHRDDIAFVDQQLQQFATTLKTQLAASRFF